jgi:hypothetical protein
MKYLITVLMGAATITVAVTTALAQAKGALSWHAMWKPPFVYGYGAAGVLLLIAIATSIRAIKQESKPASSEKLADAKHKQNVLRVTALMRQGSDLYQALQSAAKHEVVPIMNTRSEWVDEMVKFLKDEAEWLADAEAVFQLRHKMLTPEQLAKANHMPDWTREEATRLQIYRETLDHIRDKHRLY